MNGSTGWRRANAFVLALGLSLAASVAWTAEARVAVAANFIAAATEIGDRFERNSDHRVSFSFGSTGQLYAQISQGAPFDVFLAADRKRPERAVTERLAVAGSRFTYATGRIVLFSRDPDLVRNASTLEAAKVTRIAIANPVTAPYGAAAVAAMRALGVYAQLEPRLVQGHTIAQVHQFVETKNAELGFVALSQVILHQEGSRWLVPETLHPEIAQDAVLLEHGAHNEAASRFIDFLRGPEAAAVKRKYGYGSGH